MYCSQAATTVIQLFAASVVNKLIYDFMDKHYGELQFAHTFSQKNYKYCSQTHTLHRFPSSFRNHSQF